MPKVRLAVLAVRAAIPVACVLLTIPAQPEAVRTRTAAANDATAESLCEMPPLIPTGESSGRMFMPEDFSGPRYLRNK